MHRDLVLGVLLAMVCVMDASAAELLYNGIQLPAEWPPRVAKLTRDPLATPPYLVSPPAVIPIDVGRQLFVDDFLVQETTLTRTHHLAEYYPANPVLRPETALEQSSGAGAMVYSDGVWYDPADRLFKAFYMAPAGLPRSTCLATSRDGIHWDRPDLGVVAGTNAVIPDEEGLYRDSATTWLDLFEPDPARRYKMFRVMVRDWTENGAKRSRKWMKVHFSPDGVHWTLAGESDDCGDRTTVFYNPFRRRWVFSLRSGTTETSRCRAYHESADVLAGIRWEAGGRHQWTLWVGADRLDPERHDLNLEDPVKSWDAVPVQLYNLDCAGYESVLLGMFSIWRGQPRDRGKPNEICVGYSRDGFHWTRPDRRAFIPVSEHHGDWNWTNVQSAGGCCLVVGDKLHFYMKGSAGAKGNKGLGVSGTGLATLRRDGFTSLDAGDVPGTLTTRPVTFRGKCLFVNLAAAGGELRVEVLDGEGKPLGPFTRENCRPLSVDSTLQQVAWDGAADLGQLAGQPVRFRFHLRRGELYGFWVSPDSAGASGGFVAAGGPGFSGPADTVGQAAYEAAKALAQTPASLSGR